MKVPKIHLSRKLMLILGGVLVTLGGTGAAAVYIGADKLLGPSYAELNGLECTEVKTVEIHKKDRFWVRKFITTDEPGDGLARVKTALRVAKTLQETKKADLVQVVVLDASGPKDRSGMRGRAVGADIIYVPDPSHVPEELSARVLTARYADGLAAPNGEFFGERVDMLEADIQALVAKLNDQTDCVKPEGLVTEAEGEKAEGHGETSAKDAKDAHGEEPAEGHGEADGKGEDHGDAPEGEHGEETPIAEHGAEESKGWMASLMGMVGLGGEDAPAEGHAESADGDGAVAEGHEAPAGDQAEPAALAAAAPAADVDDPVADAVQAESPVQTEEEVAGGDADGDVVPTEESSAEEQGWFASLKNAVGLGGSEEEAQAPVEDTAAKAEDAPAPAGAASTDHGAAWLEQMRAQPITPDGAGAAAPATKPEEHGAATEAEMPAEDEAILPPKAKAEGDEHAKADH